MPRLRKIVLWTLVAFFVYAVLTSPDQAANIVQSAWDLVFQAFNSIASFFNNILQRN